MGSGSGLEVGVDKRWEGIRGGSKCKVKGDLRGNVKRGGSVEELGVDESGCEVGGDERW